MCVLKYIHIYVFDLNDKKYTKNIYNKKKEIIDLYNLIYDLSFFLLINIVS